MSFNYFDLLQIPVSFSLDMRTLENNYLRLQSIYHPDNALNEKEKMNLINASADLNIAYKTLNCDVARAEHLLSLFGMKLEQCKSHLLKQILETTFLAHETLQNIETFDQLDQFLSEQQDKRKKLLSDIDKAFLRKDFESCLVLVSNLKYLEGIILKGNQQRIL